VIKGKIKKDDVKEGLKVQKMESCVQEKPGRATVRDTPRESIEKT